ncbi:MAG: MraY family glycosyltransferase [bacterium]|nr:MraY family glycosyltransferase [bacterium]
MTRTELSAFLIVFALAFSITLALIPLMDRLGKRFGIVSKAGGRRLNEGDFRRVSKLGGLAIYSGFIIAAVAAQFLNVPRFDPNEVIRFIGLTLGATIIMLLGLLDDLYELKPVVLGIGQILAAAIAIAFQIFIETFNNPLTGQQTDPWPHLVTVVLTMFWLGLMMNTVNFMDGLDGLVGGVAFIAGTLLFLNGAFVLNPPQTSVSLLPLALMGASLAFLLHNFYPARIFMGGGAYFMGYALGTLSIIGGAKMATILLVIGLPLMDLAWQVVNRMSKGRNPMLGDRGHLHFRLLDAGFTQRQIVMGYYVFCAFFGALTLLLTSQLYKFIAFGVMMSLIAVGFIVLNRFTQVKAASSSQA